jgi:lipopolysaccharide export system permease protein
MTSRHTILNNYMSRQFFLMWALFIVGIVGLMALFDAIELMRRVGKVAGFDLGLVLFLTALKMPGNAMIVAPFTILFAGMMIIHQLIKRQEIVIMRAAGASIWQVLYPLFVVSLLIGTLMVGVVNPMAAATKEQYRQYESQYLKRERNIVAVLNKGLWLRVPTTQGYAIMHAGQVTMPGWGVDDVSVLFLSGDQQILGRLDAPSGQLVDRTWVFPNAQYTRTGAATVSAPDYKLPAGLNARELEENFSTPETVSFWAMPAYIQMMQMTGFPVAALKVQYWSLWLMPLLCVGLIMIAGAVTIRPPRAGGQIWAASLGIIAGFIIFFSTNFLQALGSAGQIPVLLAAIAPAFLTLAAGIIAMFALEDR